jgi:hypothetical protein
MGQKSLLFRFSYATPQRTAYREVPSQKAAHLRTGGPLYAGEISGFEPRTAVSQSGVTVSLPMSHHCSLMRHHCSLLEQRRQMFSEIVKAFCNHSHPPSCLKCNIPDWGSQLLRGSGAADSISYCLLRNIKTGGKDGMPMGHAFFQIVNSSPVLCC